MVGASIQELTRDDVSKVSTQLHVLRQYSREIVWLRSCSYLAIVPAVAAADDTEDIDIFAMGGRLCSREGGGFVAGT